MVTIFNVDVNDLINALALKLKEYEQISAPEWAMYIKTGTFKQRPPENPDWWFVRCAAILRSVYILGPIGVSKLRKKYGGKKDRGYQPEIFRKGSGSIARKALFQLQEAGLISKVEKGKKIGRIISPKGLSLLDNTAKDLMQKQKSQAKPMLPKKNSSDEATKTNDSVSLSKATDSQKKDKQEKS